MNKYLCEIFSFLILLLSIESEAFHKVKKRKNYYAASMCANKTITTKYKEENDLYFILKIFLWNNTVLVTFMLQMVKNNSLAIRKCIFLACRWWILSRTYLLIGHSSIINTIIIIFSAFLIIFSLPNLFMVLFFY